MADFAVLGYIVWLPLFFWIGAFFWFKLVSFPLYFKKLVKKGKKWAYIPDYVKSNSSKLTLYRVGDLFFCILVPFLTSLSLSWCLWKWTSLDPVFGLGSAVVFVFLSLVLRSCAFKSMGKVFESAYFLEYRRVRYASEIKGNFQSEVDVHNKTIWSFTKKLKNAEVHGRLKKYVMAMAYTKKIPPDVYAETMYV